MESMLDIAWKACFTVATMNSRTKYIVQFLLGLAGYALGLIIMNAFFKQESPLKYGLILLPIVPLVYIILITIGHVARLDEMWRRIVTEAMAFSGLATGFTCFSYIFIRPLGLPAFQPEWAFYMMWLYYGIGTLWFGNKYR